MARNLKIKVVERQTIFDIGLQYYGNCDGVFLLLEDNPELPGLDVRLLGGQWLKITSDAIDKDMVELYRIKGYVPVSEVEDIDSFFSNIQLVQDGDYQLLQDGSYQLLQ